MKGEADIDSSKFAKESDLANLESDVDWFYINKLETASVDLCKLSIVVKRWWC